MNTLLIHQAFVLPGEPGGTRHFELARHAVEQGEKFTVVASERSYLTGTQVTGADSKLDREQYVDGVHIVRAYTYPSLHSGFVWRVISFLSFMLASIWSALRAGPIDLVMGTSPPIFQAFSAWLVAAIRRKPLLLEVRDLWPEFAIDMGILRNPLLIRMSRWLEGFLYARATHILVNSPAYRDYVIAKGIAPEKVTLIPNGVDPSMFNPDSTGESVKERWDLQGKFVLTYAGALGMANDIPTIITAAEQLKEHENLRFLLVGDGMKRKELEEMVAQKELKNIIFTGVVPKDEMVDILAASDVCLATLQDIPMFKTTYPNKVFDYMAAGRPTILGIDGVIRKVIDDAEGGLFVQPGNSEDLATAALQLANDQESAKEMGRNARCYVVENFNRADQSAQFVKLLTQIFMAS